MKKIINGKKYNTDTATICCTIESQGTTFDLYRKHSGEFFFHEWGVESMIRPYDEDMAKIWMEDKASVEEYEAIFGECSE